MTARLTQLMDGFLTQLMDGFLVGNVAQVVNGVFDCMAVAEEIIKAANLTPEVNRAVFGIMCPSDVLRGKSMDVYRAHARELVERAKVGEDTRPGTKAEVLCAMMGAALKAPLNAGGLALAEWLFSECFPGHSISRDAGHRREFYKGQIAQDYAAAQRQLYDRDRKLEVLP